jgi:hypothetical protein
MIKTGNATIVNLRNIVESPLFEVLFVEAVFWPWIAAITAIHFWDRIHHRDPLSPAGN